MASEFEKIVNGTTSDINKLITASKGRYGVLFDGHLSDILIKVSSDVGQYSIEGTGLNGQNTTAVNRTMLDIGRLNNEFVAVMTEGARSFTQTGIKTAVETNLKFFKAMERAFGIDLSSGRTHGSEVTDFFRSQVSDIKGLNSTLLGQLKSLLTRADKGGRSIAKTLTELKGLKFDGRKQELSAFANFKALYQNLTFRQSTNNGVRFWMHMGPQDSSTTDISWAHMGEIRTKKRWELDFPNAFTYGLHFGERGWMVPVADEFIKDIDDEDLKFLAQSSPGKPVTFLEDKIRRTEQPLHSIRLRGDGKHHIFDLKGGRFLKDEAFVDRGDAVKRRREL